MGGCHHCAKRKPPWTDYHGGLLPNRTMNTIYLLARYFSDSFFLLISSLIFSVRNFSRGNTIGMFFDSIFLISFGWKNILLVDYNLHVNHSDRQTESGDRGEVLVHVAVRVRHG